MIYKTESYSNDSCTIKKFTAYAEFFGSEGPEVGYVKVSENPTGFLAEDFKGSHPKVNIVEITDLYVDPKFRHEGIGSALINLVINNYKASIGLSFNSNTVILTAVGASCKEYKEQPASEEIQNIISQLILFYEKNGFIDINGYYTNYENKRAMIFNSPLATKCINERKSFVDRFNAEMKSRHEE